MKCFENLIGLKEQCQSSSGLYINSLGINESMLNDIITSEHSTASEFLNEMALFAFRQVKASVYAKLLPFIKTNTVLENIHVGEIVDDKIIVNGINNKYKGVYLGLNNINGYYTIYLSKGSLFTNYNGIIAVKIIDITTGNILDSINVTTTAGNNVIFDINKAYNNNKRELKLFIGYDSSNINSYKVVNKKYCQGCVSKSLVSVYERQINITSTLTFSSLETANDTGGLQLDLSVQCDKEGWLCTYKNLLATPILYKTAYLILDYAITNRTRVNYTKIDIDWAKDRKAEFDFEFNRQMQSVLQYINVPNDRNCFICNDVVAFNTLLP